ncbi:hypothetical protein CCHR01_13073 [Colletotrichum chrysophilum]|uniref:Uncharacterized protein n=1 Tax=Colletotrichum chrysophilum TaxID=1836956 RepID=A0AAD9ABA8_9PEZI|nr:hypothetical protein CCHR01_13073 [Colletotrichum chrysophilum]
MATGINTLAAYCQFIPETVDKSLFRYEDVDPREADFFSRFSGIEVEDEDIKIDDAANLPTTDAAARLVVACRKRFFPMDEEISHTFGFKFFAKGADRARLFRVYCHIVHSGTADEQLRKACEDDDLQELLISSCNKTGLADDAAWLKGLQGFSTNSQCPVFGNIFCDVASQWCPPQLCDTIMTDIRPLAKRQAFVFWTQMKLGLIPNVDEDNWIDLGFCTAPNWQSLLHMRRAYRKLLHETCLDEFWSAVTHSTIPFLFEKHGLSNEISGLRNFRGLMKVVAQSYESVWQLKRYAQWERTGPVSAVAVDYGFMNCKTPKQCQRLRQLYADYFAKGKDEMKLHQACIRGNLAPFLREALGRLSVPDQLLTNAYPVEPLDQMGMITVGKTIFAPPSVHNEAEIVARAEGNGARVVSILESHTDSMRGTMEDMAASLHDCTYS